MTTSNPPAVNCSAKALTAGLSPRGTSRSAGAASGMPPFLATISAAGPAIRDSNIATRRPASGDDSEWLVMIRSSRKGADHPQGTAQWVAHVLSSTQIGASRPSSGGSATNNASISTLTGKTRTW